MLSPRSFIFVGVVAVALHNDVFLEMAGQRAAIVIHTTVMERKTRI